MDDVADRRGGGDEAEIELALEALPDDLHVQQPEEPAAKAEAEGGRGLGLVGDAGVVEPELLQRLPQPLELVAVDRVQPAEHHGLGVAITLQGRCGAGRLGDGLARAGLGHVLDAGDQVAHLARTQAGDGGGRGGADPHLVGVVAGLGLQEAQPGPGGQGALHHPQGGDHPPVLVEPRVEDERLQGGVGITLGRRDALDHGIQQLRDPLPRLGADAQDRVGRYAQHLLDLGRSPVGVGGREVDLVEGGHDLQVVLQRQVAVGQGLGLDALGGVDEQHHPLASGQRPRHLVAEVDMSRGVDQVEDVVLPGHPHVLGLDGDAALAFDVHGVEVLRLHVAGLDCTGELEDPVGQRRLPVVDVGDDRQRPES